MSLSYTEIKNKILEEILKNLTDKNYDAVDILATAYQRLASV